MLPQHCLGKEVALCEVGMGASRIPGEALRPKARETARRSLEPTEAPPIQATQEGPDSPCREHLGNYIRSFKIHLLYAGRALGTTVGTRQSDRDPDKDNGDEIKRASHCKPQQVWSAPHRGDWGRHCPGDMRTGLRWVGHRGERGDGCLLLSE